MSTILISCNKEDTLTNASKVNFTYTYTNIDSTKIQFTDQSTLKNIISWKWYFGDDISFEGKNNHAEHEYQGITTQETKKVKLVITDANNIKDSIEQSVLVGRKQIITLKKPTIASTIDYSYVKDGDFTNANSNLTLTANVDYIVDKYKWIIDGITQTDNTATIKRNFTKSENHNISVSVISSGQETSSNNYTITVNVYDMLNVYHLDVSSNMNNSDQCKVDIFPSDSISLVKVAPNGSYSDGIFPINNYWNFNKTNCDGFPLSLTTNESYTARFRKSDNTPKSNCVFSTRAILQEALSNNTNLDAPPDGVAVLITPMDGSRGKINMAFYVGLHKAQ